MALHLWFAWLLRSDARSEAPLDDEEAQRDFIVWWLLYGRHEYPLAPPPDVRAVSVAHEQVTVSTATGNARLPRLFAAIWRGNPVWSQRFDISRRQGVADFLSACCLSVVREASIESFVPQTVRDLLLGPDERMPQLGQRPVGHLLRFLWAHTPALQSQFDPRTPAGQDGMASWFAGGGADACGLGWLTAPPAPATRPRHHRPMTRSGGVNVIGYAFGALGVGEDVRMLAASFEAAGIEFCVVSRTPIGDRGPGDDWIAAHVVEEPLYDISILCMSGLDSATLLLDRPDLLSGARYLIGYWPWELPRWPAVWRDALNIVDEIWVSSHYTREAFTPDATVPVLKMPMAVTIDRLELVSRDAFGLHADRFLFLYVFDGNSYLARKNPLAAVEAFRRAFPAGDEKVGLVLKMMGGNRSDPAMAAFLAACDTDSRITIVDGVMPRGEVLGLIAACDAYISLHRAEGFGRTIAEAMLLRRPVIATAFSGSNELVTEETAIPVAWQPKLIAEGEYPFGAGQWWADPDIDDAASAMQRLVESSALRTMLIEAARRHVAEHHGPGGVGARYAERLEAIARNLGSVMPHE